MGGRSREQLEGKVRYLEHRMAMLERFVEMRFCETFRDFAIRNGGAAAPAHNLSFTANSHRSTDPEEVTTVGGCEEMEMDEPPPPRVEPTATRHSLRKKTPSAKAKAMEKEVRISIIRLDSSSNKSPEGKGTAKASTSSQGHAAAEAVKLEVADDSAAAEDGDDDFVTFSGDEGNAGGGGDDYTPDADPVDPNDTNLSSASSDEETSDRRHSRKRKRKSGSTSQKRDSSEATETCPYCQKNYRPEFMNKHLQDFHCRERHLKCAFCPKRYFSELRRKKHEMIHQKDKLGKRCRVPNCPFKTRLYVDSFQALKHERQCIRRELEAGRPVDDAVLENVWLRSRHRQEPLGWPEEVVKRLRNKSLLSAEEIERIVKLSSFSGKWLCSICDAGTKSFGDKHELKRHLTNFHGRGSRGTGESGQGNRDNANNDDAVSQTENIENQSESPQAIENSEDS